MDVMDKLNAFERSIKQGGKRFRLVNLIPAWRFDWQYPPVAVNPRNVAGGHIVPGTYQVRVSAVDVCDNTSAASVPQVIVLTATDNAIGVRIPRVPYSSPLFKQYKVFVNGRQEGVVDLPYRVGLLYPEIVIKDLLGTGAAPLDPSNTVRVRWQLLRVTGWASSSREDEIKNGVFTGSITLQTTVEQEHDRVQVPTIGYLEVDTTLNTVERFSITVGVE
jgi:hypothetical protein